MTLSKSIGDWAIPSLWASKYRLLGGTPMMFMSRKDPLKYRPWAIALLDDMSPKIVCIKARQMGVTEINLCTKAIHFASLTTSTTVYTLPTNPKAREIVHERVNPLGDPTSPRRYVPEIRTKFSDDWERSVEVKHLVPRNGGGHSAILVSGSWNESLGESTAADGLYIDEYDRSKMSVEAAFRKSLSSSPYGFMNVFSTPTFPGFGVDARYQQSDKKRWFYKCPRCGKWVTLTRDSIRQCGGTPSLIQRLEAHDMSAVVPPGTFEFICVKCGGVLDRWSAKAQWVPEHSDYREWSIGPSVR